MNIWDGSSDRRDVGSQRGPDRVDWDEMLTQVQLAQRGFNGVDPTTLQSVGAVASVTGLTVEEFGDGALHKTVLTLDTVELDTTDGTTPATDGAWAALQLYTFPTGTKFCNYTDFDFNVTANNAGAVGLADDSDFDLGVGSVAVAQATAFSLSGTQSDYAEYTAALIAKVDACQVERSTALTLTSTALILNLRTVDNADHGILAGLLEVSGTITILWTMVK